MNETLQENENVVSRIALASEPNQRKPDTMPLTAKLFQPAAKIAKRRVANVSNAGKLFVLEAAPLTLKYAAPPHVQFANVLSPINHKRLTRRKTIKYHHTWQPQ